MHRTLEAMNAYVLKGEDGRWPTRILGMSRTNPVTRAELAEVIAFEERERVRLEEQGAPIRARVEQTALVAQLQSALHSLTPQVSAYFVVTTYNPQRSFQPGEDVYWSGHLSREEGERVVPLWERYLTDSGRHTNTYVDFRVEYRSGDIHRVRRDGWEGPRR